MWEKTCIEDSSQASSPGCDAGCLVCEAVGDFRFFFYVCLDLKLSLTEHMLFSKWKWKFFFKKILRKHCFKSHKILLAIRIELKRMIFNVQKDALNSISFCYLLIQSEKIDPIYFYMYDPTSTSNSSWPDSRWNGWCSKGFKQPQQLCVNHLYFRNGKVKSFMGWFLWSGMGRNGVLLCTAHIVLHFSTFPPTGGGA
jgi:hypothetical protein